MELENIQGTSLNIKSEYLDEEKKVPFSLLGEIRKNNISPIVK